VLAEEVVPAGVPQGSLTHASQNHAQGQRMGTLLGSQNQGSGACHHDRVLELRNQARVRSTQRPSVLVVNDVIGRDRQERLDGQHQSLAKHHLLAVVEARD
jgi:hypothetical protein